MSRISEADDCQKDTSFPVPGRWESCVGSRKGWMISARIDTQAGTGARPTLGAGGGKLRRVPIPGIAPGSSLHPGIQGDDARASLAPDRLPCMSKVMTGYCAPQAGLNIAPASRGIGSILLYPRLPDRVPTHWNLHGQVDETMPKL
jgi:hypothetical protein